MKKLNIKSTFIVFIVTFIFIYSILNDRKIKTINTNIKNIETQLSDSDSIINQQFIIIDKLNDTIDSLHNIILKESEPYKVFLAIGTVESKMNPLAKNGQYIGCLQIGRSMLNHANKIRKKHNLPLFKSDDRLTIEGSYAIFKTVMDESNPTYNLKIACKKWNPTAGDWYYRRVLNAYYKNN